MKDRNLDRKEKNTFFIIPLWGHRHKNKITSRAKITITVIVTVKRVTVKRVTVKRVTVKRSTVKRVTVKRVTVKRVTVKELQ